MQSSIFFITTTFAFACALPLNFASQAVGIRFNRSQFTNTSSNYDGIGAGQDVYQAYHGDGSPEAGWPTMSQWISYQDMFESNTKAMRNACTNLGLPPAYDTTDAEIGTIRDAIAQVSVARQVDHRFILAILMQESLGCVRVYTTRNSVANPGIMQDHAGTNTCNNGTQAAPNGQFPCPLREITGMIDDGVGGTVSGNGLAADLNDAMTKMPGLDGSRAQIYYVAARMYNSGNVDISDLGYAFSSTPSYASDVANRLTGWVFAQKTYQ